jgi:hypothetical protein
LGQCQRTTQTCVLSLSFCVSTQASGPPEGDDRSPVWREQHLGVTAPELRKRVAGAALVDLRATPLAWGGEGGRSSSARKGRRASPDLGPELVARRHRPWWRSRGGGRRGPHRGPRSAPRPHRHPGSPPAARRRGLREALADEVVRAAGASAGAPAPAGAASRVRGGASGSATRRMREGRACVCRSMSNARAWRRSPEEDGEAEGEEQGRPRASTGWGDLRSPVLRYWRRINFGWPRFHCA